MITGLTIKRFGVFQDSQWHSDLPKFERHNVLYGWNYSGKTTISRIFRCFETRILHTDYPQPQFTLTADDGNTFSQEDVGTENFPPVRVFNSDFVAENLRWYHAEDQIEPIFLLGEENIELQKRLSELRGRQTVLGERNGDLNRQARIAKTARDDALTDRAREIKNTLLLPDFNRDKLIPYVEQVDSDPRSYLVDQSTFADTLATYRSLDKMDSVVLADLSALTLNTITAAVERIITSTISVARIIDELRDDDLLNIWVNKGRPLHRTRITCGFCGQALPAERLQRLDEHFSHEYDRLQHDFDTALAQIQEQTSDIASVSLPVASQLYNELRDSFHQKQLAFAAVRKGYLDQFARLEAQLYSKKAKPFEPLVAEPIVDSSSDLLTAFDELRSVIGRHNEKTDNFDKERDTARTKLLCHEAADFITEKNYPCLPAEIDRASREASENEEARAKCQEDIASIESRLSDTVKGAERVNQYIEQLTGRGLIRLEVTPESKFRVMRGAAQARNLSEGEMTAISLAYFVARLEDKGTNLADTIVFIDDPVSSFDHNHLFAAYALIKTKLSNCAQLFVATHNLDFFNLMKDFLREFKKPNTQRLYQDRLPCYLVQREFNALRDCALIRDAPRLLTAFKSEYVYLFALLRDFADRGGGADYEMLYLVPNVVRRFLEAYSGFTRPGCRDPDQRYSTLFPDETKRALVLKFANEHSHIQSADRTLKFPEAAECKQVVETVLAAIESCDKTHFESLCDACV